MPAAVSSVPARVAHIHRGHLSGCVLKISTCHRQAMSPGRCCLQITAYLTGPQEDAPEEAAAAEEDAEDDDAG